MRVWEYNVPIVLLHLYLWPWYFDLLLELRCLKSMPFFYITTIRNLKQKLKKIFIISNASKKKLLNQISGLQKRDRPLILDKTDYYYNKIFELFSTSVTSSRIHGELSKIWFWKVSAFYCNFKTPCIKITAISIDDPCRKWFSRLMWYQNIMCPNNPLLAGIWLCNTTFLPYLLSTSTKKINDLFRSSLNIFRCLSNLVIQVCLWHLYARRVCRIGSKGRDKINKNHQSTKNWMSKKNKHTKPKSRFPLKHITNRCV